MSPPPPHPTHAPTAAVPQRASRGHLTGGSLIMDHVANQSRSPRPLYDRMPCRHCVILLSRRNVSRKTSVFRAPASDSNLIAVWECDVMTRAGPCVVVIGAFWIVLVLLFDTH